MGRHRSTPTVGTNRRQLLVIATVLAVVASACVRSVGDTSTGCPQIAATGVSPGQALLTLTTRFTNVYPVEDISVCLELSDQNGDVVYADGFAVNGLETREIDLVAVPVDTQRYTLNWTYTFPPGATETTCTESLSFDDGVDTRAMVVLNGRCAARVAETEGWLDSQGVTVASEEVEEFSSAGGHCEKDGARFITLGGYFEGAAYVNDASGYFPPNKFLSSEARTSLGLESFDEYRGPELEADAYLTFRSDATLPADAVSLGYTRGVRELFASPSDNGDYLYVVRPDRVERWPLLRPVDACV